MLKDLSLRNDHGYTKNQKTKTKKDRIKNIIDKGDNDTNYTT